MFPDSVSQIRSHTWEHQRDIEESFEVSDCVSSPPALEYQTVHILKYVCGSVNKTSTVLSICWWLLERDGELWAHSLPSGVVQPIIVLMWKSSLHLCFLVIVMGFTPLPRGWQSIGSRLFCEGIFNTHVISLFGIIQYNESQYYVLSGLCSCWARVIVR